MSLKTYFNIILLSLVFSYSCTSNQKQVSLENEVDSFLSTQENFNGVVLITSKGKPIYTKAKGLADIDNNRPLKMTDQFIIGSISKQITAVLVLKAYEEGLLKLTDTISNYLLNIPSDWVNTITIHHLLTHTHGIRAIDRPLMFEAGSQFQYSQLGYRLLGQILEVIREQSFEEIAMSFFKEIGLHHTFHPNNKGYKNLVKSYVEQEDKTIEFQKNSLYNYAAAGSFISTAADLALWNQLLHQHKLVNAASLNLMSTRYATRDHPIFETIEYGYGLLFKKGENTQQIGALGYAPGFASALYHYPQKDITIVVLQNIARNLSDFQQTFVVQTEIMNLAKQN